MADPKNTTKTEVTETVETVTLPAGFNVVASGNLLGTYPTEEIAKDFITGHLVPQGIEASIVESAGE